ncbi:hypothetical protein [Methylovulum miyakonense]|uniref:hypothetical protein n=1 Tax=Methylovulum miyakonense TaxID=645578 RepID=UPI0003634494|nr:hypothetical protein [Methylovulum miyakonense]
MAKELFMTQWFSKEMVVAGENLIKRLDESDAQVQAAFWLLDDKEKTWELTIVSPLVESEGPRNYYKRINDINESTNSEEVISLHDIRVSDTNNRIVKALKRSVLGTAILGNNRLGKNFIGGVYFEDMYIYRMDWALLDK